MGKGRTTTGMIVATLMADIAQVQQCNVRQSCQPLNLIIAKYFE